MTETALALSSDELPPDIADALSAIESLEPAVFVLGRAGTGKTWLLRHVAANADRQVAIVAPTGGPAWPTDLVNGDHFGGGSSSMPAAAGYPNITVPTGLVFGLPVGMSFFGPAFSEERLIGVAAAYERELSGEGRQPPGFRESADL